MHWENTLVRVLTDRVLFSELFPVTKQIQSALSDNTKWALKCLQKFYRDNPSAQGATMQAILASIKVQMGMASVTDEDRERFTSAAHLFANVLSSNPSAEEVRETRNQLANLKLSGSAYELLQQYASGDLEVDLGTALAELVEGCQSVADYGAAYAVVNKSLTELIEANDPDGGYTYPLKALNSNLKTMKDGDFIGIAAPNNVGKTGLALQFAHHLARQLGENDKVLYVNNEGVGDHIVSRIWQQVLDKSFEDMCRDNAEGVNFDEKYADIKRDVLDKIIVVDAHDCTIAHIKAMYRKWKPKVVVLDMIDAVGGFEDAGREDIKYKKLYGWFRAQAANHQHRHICIATTQVSEGGFEFAFIPKKYLESSKTAKQSQVDTLIMINNVNPENPYERSIWVPRSKRHRYQQTEHTSKFFCTVSPEHGAYRDAPSKDTPYNKPEET